MNVDFSDHAKIQIQRREIPKNRIVETVQNPEETENSYRGRVLQRKRYQDKILEVVTITEDRRIIIVTAYYLKPI
jgi:hypothetical protein